MQELKIVKLTEEVELYCRYPSEFAPQPAFLFLDLEAGEMWCDYTAGDGLPESIYHRRTLTWAIPILAATRAHELMDEAAPLARRILAGAEIEWDGGNHVGALDDDAQDAERQIEHVIETYQDADVVTEMDAQEWYSTGDDPADELGLTADTTDDELREMTRQTRENMIRDTAEMGAVKVRGVWDYLVTRRDEMRETVRDALAEAASEVREVSARRDRLVRQIAAWGTDSTRDIATIADRSHTWVRNIVGC